MSPGRRPGLALGCVAAALAVTVVPTLAQGFRAQFDGRGSFIEMRPLARDSVPESQVPGDGLRRKLADGTWVSCTPDDFCRWYGAASTQMVSVITQDLRVSGWGGPPGLSGRVHVRGRFGSDEFWPGTRRDVDLVAAYADYDRGRIRAQVGRIGRSDGLGYYNFDGATFLYRGPGRFWIEGYAGSSLVTGLNEPRTGVVFAETEDLPPDDRGWLLGARAGGQVGPVSGSVAYQRDIRTDRKALYSERVAVDLRALVGRWALDASTDFDWMTATFNDARLRATVMLPGDLELSAEGRHFEPFFESWTIWGAFSPVGFDEARGAVAWRWAEHGLRFEASGGYRSYGDTGTQLEAQTVREDGWRLGGAGTWDGAGWSALLSYYADVGPGAARYGGDASFGRSFGSSGFVSLRGSRTQTFGELRFNEQFVTGVGLDASWRIHDFSLNGGASIYRLDGTEQPDEDDWTQARAYGGVTVYFGRDPGMSR
ncbi:MAG: hypothetical protein R3195_15225 [Gemmatimonadota bacterium]|nr:hypothetical protein [Gemmatimonadota bacterium]